MIQTLSTTAITPTQARQRLACSRTTLYELLRSGKLKGVKITPRKWAIPLSAIESLLQTQSQH
jgi:excisionase family DNA binding protein